MKVFEYIKNYIDTMNNLVGQLISWGSVVLVLLVTFDVVLRYCFNKSFIASQELELTIFSSMFLLGAGYTLTKDSHVRVDVIYHRLSKRKKAFINCIGTIIFLIPGCFLAIKTAIPFVEASWRIGESSPDPGGLPAYYLIKGLIPLGFLLLALQAISFFVNNLRLLLGKQAGKDVKH